MLFDKCVAVTPRMSRPFVLLDSIDSMVNTKNLS